MLKDAYGLCQNWFKYSLITTILLSFNIVHAKELVADEGVTRKVTQRDSIIAQSVLTLLQQGHFNKKVLDDTLSASIFDEYFDALDPNRYYFLSRDVEEFYANRIILDDLIRKGNLDFSFEIFERFILRVQQRHTFIQERLKKPFDFSKDETIELDRSNAPWEEHVEGLNELWRKRLKNQLMIQELAKEFEAKQAKDDEEGKEEKPKEAEVFQRTPVEVVMNTFFSMHKRYIDFDTSDVLQLYLTTIANVFDPHSSYMNRRTLEDFNIDMSLKLEGIGAVLTVENGYTKIVRIMPGGPANQDGRLQPGDRIVAVRQDTQKEPVDIIFMPLSKVVRMIRGEKGTVVHLTVMSGITGVPKVINITRDEVKVESSAASGEIKTITMDNGEEESFAYVYLPSFYADWAGIERGDKDARSATKDVRKLIDEMLAEKPEIKGIVLDLRGNGGGSLDEAIKLSGIFIPEGIMVQVKSLENVIARGDKDRGFYYDQPLVVMVDHTSASASEITAGAIQDYERGIIFGDKQTHGKGTVQQVLRLSNFPQLKPLNPGALKFTSSKFYRVTGESTQKRGVASDITYPSFLDHLDVGESKLKHVLPWDEIKPKRFTIYSPSVKPLIPELTKLSQKRVENDPKFQTLFEQIEEFGVRQAKKEVSLNIDVRRKQREEDEKWAEVTKQVFDRNRSDDDSNKEKTSDNDEEVEEKKKDEDPYLDEALLILSDLSAMEK
ncbi:MAG: carboxy terminal-processing peptidase [Lentisphaeria bacterium]|nr:carboxy terminal-processing peptidase [Lentisphaeria bacterium]